MADLEALDIFGVFAASNSASMSSSSFTAADYIQVVMEMGSHLHLDPDLSRHLFNLPELDCNDDNEEEQDSGDCSLEAIMAKHPEDSVSAPPGPLLHDKTANDVSRRVNPPMCCHLLREDVHQYLNNAASIPTALCRAPGDVLDGPSDARCRHRGPHVHCARCLGEVAGAVDDGSADRATFDLRRLPPALEELKDAWGAHYAMHRARSERRLELLDGTRIAYIGDSDDEYDLESETGMDACEADAAEDQRHGCFLISAGTAAAPVIIAYCADCEQFAPMVRFAAKTHDDGDEGNDAPCPSSTASLALWSSEGISNSSHMVMARLLLACHFYLSCTPTADAAAGSTHSEHEDAAVDESRVFMYKPEFFDFLTEEHLIDAFEEGIECTDATAVLPDACVVGHPPEPRLMLLSSGHEEAEDEKREETRCGYVEGFLVTFANAAMAQERLAFLQSHRRHLRVARRLVFQRDANAWAAAWVPYHYDQNNNNNNSDHNDSEKDLGEEETGRDNHSLALYCDAADTAVGAIRQVAGERFAVDVPVPPTLQRWATEQSVASEGEEDGSDAVMQSIMGDFPFSLESRTVHFFTVMTAIAKAMREVLVAVKPDDKK